MGWRFRRSKKILPGVRASISHRGIGIRVGTRNAGVSVTPTGARVSGSIPGTGISASKELRGAKQRSDSHEIDELDSYEGEELEQVEAGSPSRIMSAILIPIYAVGFFVTAALGLVLVLDNAMSMKVTGGVFAMIALVCAIKIVSRLRAFR